MAGETKLDLNALVASYTGSPEDIAKIRKQLEKEFAIDFTSERVYDPSTGSMNDIYKDQRAKAIVENRAFIDRYISANKELAQVTSAGMVADATTALASGYTAVNINGISAWRDGSGAIFLDGASSASARDTAKAFMKTNDEERGKLQAWNAATAASPQANAEAVLGDLRKISLQRTIADADRAAAMSEAAANRASSVALAQTATVQTIITTKIDESTGKEVWVVRQILKNGTTQDTLYNPNPADRAKALYTASDGSIGTLGEDNQVSNWTYRPPILFSEGENKYTVDWDAKLQNYDTSKRIQIAKPGQKLEMYNGQLYVTEIIDGKITATKVANVPAISEADRIRLENDSRNSATAEKNQVLAAAESGIKVDTAKFALESAKEGKQNAVEILAGRMTVIQGLIKSGTAADLAKAQELYQSARKDWEVEKKNATDRRDKAQDKGLRRSGMMFLRGATAVQGGKTGADAQKMWKEEYNRTPGKEGETYSERMARSLGLGADLDQNLDTTFPTFTEFANGATANVVPAPKAAVPVAVAPVTAASTVPPVPTVPLKRSSEDITANANVRTPVGFEAQTGPTNSAGWANFNTVSYTGTGPGEVPAKPLFQGQVPVAPSPQGNQTGMNADGQYQPMQVPVAMAPSREMSNDLEPARLSSNYQNGGQGYFGTPSAPVGTPSAPVGSPELRATWDEDGKQGYSEEPKESDWDKLARIHNQLNGGRGGM